MNRCFLLFLYCFICISNVSVSLAFQPLYAQPESTFNAYVQALVAEECEKAETYWLPEEIQMSKRLGIVYTGIKAKSSHRTIWDRTVQITLS